MRKIVVFSGAGLSRASGIPTFRDGDGLWHNHKVEDVADFESWYGAGNKELMLNFYKERVENVSSVEPNDGHHALARLQEKYDVVNYTQNVDDLLERAGCENVVHLHGRVKDVKCEWHKSVSNLDGDRRFKCDYEEVGTGPAKLGEVCKKCGGQLRPNVVWFHEAVDMNFNKLATLADEAYVFIGVGTSAQVSPAADLINIFRRTPLKFWVDPNPQMRLKSFGQLKGGAETEMSRLADFLLSLHV